MRGPERALVEQVDDAVGDDARLPAPGARKHEQRAL